jgi:hypothetical protein
VIVLTDLQSIMEKTIAQASPHSKEVHGQNPLRAKEVLELANTNVLILAATVKSDGKPHLSPVDLVSATGMRH